MSKQKKTWKQNDINYINHTGQNQNKHVNICTVSSVLTSYLFNPFVLTLFLMHLAAWHRNWKNEFNKSILSTKQLIIGKVKTLQIYANTYRSISLKYSRHLQSNCADTSRTFLRFQSGLIKFDSGDLRFIYLSILTWDIFFFCQLINCWSVGQCNMQMFLNWP